ncbi:MAG TPA: glycosyltransferase family 4 protein [Candidatus Woesebacteria bacterium]|nr:glycosyltransferase family 4 protein [Candidatus Woesebacteria bacterium]
MRDKILNLTKKRKAMRVIYVSTYIPQKCGIATFTKDVTTAINMLNPYALAEIMAIVKEGEENLEFPREVKYKIQRNNLESYKQAANYINNSDCDVVLIEHEFGIFGGNFGAFAVDFAKMIKKPLIMTCHTIPKEAETGYGKVLKELGKIVCGITVMTKDSQKKLIKSYGVDKKKIAFIPHGTPDIPLSSTENYKKQKGLTGKIVLGSINLISENKGLEYTIEAVAKIVKVYPEIMGVIIGQTHPGVIESEGEKYRNFLKEKVKELGIEKNIKFIDKYLSLDDLILWLKTLDFYVTPYLDPEQSSSGALAYAIGAGKICISTPYKYAKENLAKGKGVIVPFRDSEAIATSVLKIWKDKEKMKIIQKKAYEYGRFMTWTNVALQHLDMFELMAKKK